MQYLVIGTLSIRWYARHITGSYRHRIRDDDKGRMLLRKDCCFLRVISIDVKARVTATLLRMLVRTLMPVLVLNVVDA
jgi:hypothetical protein